MDHCQAGTNKERINLERKRFVFLPPILFSVVDMLSVLAQRTAFRLPALSGSLLLRPHATPIVLKPVVTRTFGSTSLLAFPKTATEVTTKTTATTKSTAKKTPAKAASRTRKIAAKKPVKKKVKKVVKKVVKPKKPKAVKKPASVLFSFQSYRV